MHALVRGQPLQGVRDLVLYCIEYTVLTDSAVCCWELVSLDQSIVDKRRVHREIIVPHQCRKSKWKRKSWRGVVYQLLHDARILFLWKSHTMPYNTIPCMQTSGFDSPAHSQSWSHIHADYHSKFRESFNFEPASSSTMPPLPGDYLPMYYGMDVIEYKSLFHWSIVFKNKLTFLVITISHHTVQYRHDHSPVSASLWPPCVLCNGGIINAKPYTHWIDFRRVWQHIPGVQVSLYVAIWLAITEDHWISTVSPVKFACRILTLFWSTFEKCVDLKPKIFLLAG